MRIEIPLLGPAAPDDPATVNPQRTVNFYARPGGEGGTYVLRSRPGFTRLATIGDGPIRAMRVLQSGTSVGTLAYVVSGSKLYEVDVNLAATEKATLQAAAGPMQLFDNGRELLLVDVGFNLGTNRAYLYDLATGGLIDLLDYGTLAFTSGGVTEIAVGDTITGAISGATATVSKVTLTSGSWAGGDAAGTFHLTGQAGAFQAENLDVGASANLATIAGDSTDLSLGFVPTSGAFLDGVFTLTERGTGKLWWSELYDGLTWEGTAFITAEAFPDNLAGQKVVGRSLWLFGEEATEIHYFTGDLTEAFRRVSGAVLEWGLAAPDAVAVSGREVYWLGKGRGAGLTVLRGSGYAAAPILDPAFERALGEYATVTDARMYAYRREGMAFVSLHFPTEGKSWLLETTSGRWCEAASWQAGAYARELAETHMYFAGRHTVGAHSTGRVYEIDPAAHSDDGATLRRQRITVPVAYQGKRLRWTRVVIEGETGVGNLVAPGDDPVLEFRYSDTDGKNWGPSRDVKMGKRGARDTVMEARSLGISRKRCLEFVVTDPVSVTLTHAWADVEVLDG